MGNASSATQTGTPAAIVCPTWRSATTRSMEPRKRIAAIKAAIVDDSTSAVRRMGPSGRNVPVASASRRRSRAAIAAPRKPAHKPRC